MRATPPPPAFLLASKSPRRRDLLASLGISFRSHSPDVEEVFHTGENPPATALRLCLEKHAAARALFPNDTMILTADTVVALRSENGWQQFGKPPNSEEVYSMLRTLEQRVHQVFTAFTLSRREKVHSQVVISAVRLRTLGETELRQYTLSKTPFDKAGGYAIQDPILQPVAHIAGSYSNVMGLPLEALVIALRSFGFTIPLTA